MNIWSFLLAMAACVVAGCSVGLGVGQFHGFDPGLATGSAVTTVLIVVVGVPLVNARG